MAYIALLQRIEGRALPTVLAATQGSARFCLPCYPLESRGG